MSNQVYISYGSNMGDLKANINQALALLTVDSKIQIERRSAFYQTAPVGPVEQADFINGALKISTDYTPDQLLVVLHQIERACRRERIIHWGPRTLDLDIIFFNELVLQSDTLVIPHPEAFKRLFVLVPILEICGADFYQKAAIEIQIDVLKQDQTQTIKRLEEVNDDRTSKSAN